MKIIVVCMLLAGTACFGQVLAKGTLKKGALTGAPFTPQRVPNLLFWSTVDSIAGTDGTKVSQWNDSSGNGHHFFELNGAGNDPVITNKVINGRPALWFDGAAAMLTNSFGVITQAQPITTFIVCAIGQSTNNSKVFDGCDLNNRIACSSATNGNTFSLFAGTTDNPGAATVVSQWYVWTHIFNGASSVIRSNGAVYLSPTTSGTLGASGLTLMARPDKTRPCLGYVAEFLAVTSDLTGKSSLTNIENYLRTKYGL